jgi:AcrR family transcriptional regulator
VTLLLDAAAALIDEKGIDGLSTSDVATRSGSSVGVVYRYFPNIQFLLRALAARNLERFLERAFPADSFPSGSFSSDSSSSEGAAGARWLERLDQPFDAYVELARAEPGFRALRFGTIIDERFVGRDDSTSGVNANDELVAALVEVLHKRYARLDPSESLLLDLEVAVEAATALLQRAFTTDSEGDPRFIAKAKSITREILTDYSAEIAAA